jgi:hypothetical protein
MIATIAGVKEAATDIDWTESKPENLTQFRPAQNKSGLMLATCMLYTTLLIFYQNLTARQVRLKSDSGMAHETQTVSASCFPSCAFQNNPGLESVAAQAPGQNDHLLRWFA